MYIPLSSGGVAIGFADISEVPSPPRLDVAIAPDGSAQADGAIPFPSGHDFVLLVAEPDTARCACVDTDGNGRAGLTRVELQAHDPRSGELVPVTLMAPAADDIDRAGRYDLDVQAGDERATLAAHVLPLRGRRKRRRRRGRKRKR